MSFRNVVFLLGSGFVLLIGLSFIPTLKLIFSQFFSSIQFQAIRFIITVFGILSIMLGLLSWYVEEKPTTRTYETSFEVLMPSLRTHDEYAALNLIENDLLWNPFTMCFSEGWKPVLTEMDAKKNVILRSFIEDKGVLVNKRELDMKLAPNKTTANIGPFYIPPNSSFNLTRKKIKDRLWTFIIIKNEYVALKLKITDLDNIGYVEMVYKKEGMWNYIFYDYREYDKWFNVIASRIKDKQVVNKIIREDKGKLA